MRIWETRAQFHTQTKLSLIEILFADRICLCDSSACYICHILQPVSILQFKRASFWAMTFVDDAKAFILFKLFDNYDHFGAHAVARATSSNILWKIQNLMKIFPKFFILDNENSQVAHNLYFTIFKVVLLNVLFWAGCNFNLVTLWKRFKRRWKA